MPVLFTNNASTTLSAGINNSTTTIPIASAGGFPSLSSGQYYFGTISNTNNTKIEIVKVASGTTSLTVTRGQDGTSAQAFDSGDNFQLRVTAATLSAVSVTDVAVTGGTVSADTLIAKGDGASADGQIQLNCRDNSHGIKLKSPPHSASANYTLTFPNNDGDANQKLTTNGSGVLTWTADTDTVYTHPNHSGDVTSSADGAQTIAADAVTGAKIADNAINSEHYTDGSIDHVHLAADCIDGDNIQDDVINSEHIAADSIDAEHYAAGSVDATALGADAVTAAKIGDDVINSEHIAAGAVDAEHMSANSIDSASYVDGSIDTAHFAAGSVDAAALGADSVTAAKIGDNVINSEHYAAASIDNEHLADNAVGTAEIANDAVTQSKIGDTAVGTAQLVDANVTTGKLANDAVTNAKIADNAIDSEHYADGSIDVAHLSSSIGDMRKGITYVGLDGGDHIEFQNNTSMKFTVNAGEEMRLEADGDLHVDGDIIAFSTTVSDATLKYDINPIDHALEKIGQLKGVTYKYLKDGMESAGLLAQDVEKVMPCAVTERKLPLHKNDGKSYKTLNYDNLHALLIESIKELTAKVEKLEKK